MNYKSNKIFGALLLGVGMAVIFLSFVIKWFGIAENFIGFYFGPLIIISGAVVLISHKE